MHPTIAHLARRTNSNWAGRSVLVGAAGGAGASAGVAALSLADFGPSAFILCTMLTLWGVAAYRGARATSPARAGVSAALTTLAALAVMGAAGWIVEGSDRSMLATIAGLVLHPGLLMTAATAAVGVTAHASASRRRTPRATPAPATAAA
jgi:hypothetical protein